MENYNITGTFEPTQKIENFLTQEEKQLTHKQKMINFFHTLEKHRTIDSFDIRNIDTIPNDLILILENKNFSNKDAMTIVRDLILLDINNKALYRLIKRAFKMKNDVKFLELEPSFLRNITNFIQKDIEKDMLQKTTKDFLVSELIKQ